MTVHELLQYLRDSSGLTSHEPYVSTPSVHTTFVAPPLDEVEPAEDRRVVLISAPAAVGKTTLANYLSRESGALLWDLSRLRLGDAVLIGSLGRAYGYSLLGDLIARLSAGDLSLVLDGLDEAYVRSGIEGLEALAADVAEVVGRASTSAGGVSLIVLGRSTAIDLFALALEDRSVSAGHLRIGFFENEAATRLIDAQAEEGISRPGYVATRDRLLGSIRASIRSEADPEDETSFLGYAPVLNALGRYLAYPAEVADALDAQPAQGGAFWQQLVRVNYDILERERRKVRNQLEAPEQVSEEFFSPEHQMRMLLSRNPLALINAGWEAETEEAQRQAAEAGRAALEGHPFIVSDRLSQPLMQRFVNTVFRDFLVAEALLGQDLETYALIMQSFWDGSYAPSSLMAFFYLRPDASGVATTAVDSELLAVIQTSLSGEMASKTEPVSLVLVEESGDVRVSVGRRGLAQTLDFSVAPSGPLVLSTPLSYASLDLSRRSVKVTPIGEELALGPKLSIRAPGIDLDGARLWVDANEDAPVLLSSPRINLLAAHVDLRQNREGALIVECADPPYPLRRFAVEPSRYSAPEDLQDALLELRRLLLWFEAGPAHTGKVGYFKKPLETAARKGRVSDHMLHYALETGLLHEDGKLYVATPDDLRLDLFRIRRREMGENEERFLRGFLEWRESAAAR
jgi:hypothetical protein